MIIDVKGVYEWLEMDATGPKDVISALRESKDNEEVEVNISSGGGNALLVNGNFISLKNAQDNLPKSLQKNGNNG